MHPAACLGPSDVSKTVSGPPTKNSGTPFKVPECEIRTRFRRSRGLDLRIATFIEPCRVHDHNCARVAVSIPRDSQTTAQAGDVVCTGRYGLSEPVPQSGLGGVE